MSAKLSNKPGIAIVGAGNLASALGTSLRAAGYRIEEIIARDQASSLRRARKLAQKVGASAVSITRAQILSEIIWFCVPDGAIAGAAASLATVLDCGGKDWRGKDWKGKVALHSSGALSSTELLALREQGAAVASVHPLMTFVQGSRASLAGVPFAIEGTPRAVRAATRIVRRLRGQPFTIRKEHKQAYHTWGMFASPLLTALLAATERVAFAAGVQPKAARQRMLPILSQTLANYARLGAPNSFSGPIARGDAATVDMHLKVLQAIPDAREIYLALARAALRDLPAKNSSTLKKILRAE
jgi:predicted short-subunit dehydrogenase-like oxidoreductase (DUF2520 family)